MNITDIVLLYFDKTTIDIKFTAHVCGIAFIIYAKGQIFKCQIFNKLYGFINF